jgi:hypothetical protein
VAQDFRITHGDAEQKLLPARTPTFAIVSFIKLGFKAFPCSIRLVFAPRAVFCPSACFCDCARTFGTKIGRQSFLSVCSSLSNQGGNRYLPIPVENKKSWAMTDFVIFLPSDK